jgi:hypothetical protein
MAIETKIEAAAALEPYGPLTTHHPEGAGGPFCWYDSAIARHRADGDETKAAALQESRASINLAFNVAERVYIPRSLVAAAMLGAVREGRSVLVAA